MTAQIKGMVQTLECRREGRIVWQKEIYIPNKEKEEVYSRYLFKKCGVFFYDLVGEIKHVTRKPRNVAYWNE